MSEVDTERAGSDLGDGGGHWEFSLPSLGADMESGTVLEWYVEPGQRVGRGDLVALVATDKADIDVEIWNEGVVVDQLVEIGHEVPVGTPLLRLAGSAASGDERESRPGLQSDAAPVEPPPPPPTTAPPPPTTAPVPSPPPVRLPGDADVAASPLARTIAAERGIDLASIAGTGPDGAILARDVEAAPAPRPSGEVIEPPTPDRAPEPPPDEDRSARMRRMIADRMARANREIPHYHLETDVELHGALQWLERHNRSRGVAERVLPAALFLRATAAAAAAVPELNGFWVNDRFQPADGIDIAVAVSLRKGGLVTPMIRDVAAKSPDEIMVELKQLVDGARRGALRSSWMTGVGITVTSLGDQGVERVNGIIHPPQVALVGFGRITERPWAVDGDVAVRPVVTVSLAADHRASDGATGSRFLNALARDLRSWEET